MSLDPQLAKLPDGKIKMTWTPNPLAQGYRLYRDGVAVARTFKASAASTTYAAEADGASHRYGLRMMDEVGPLEAADYPPLPSPEPGGVTLRFDSGNASAFSGVECKDQARQLQVVASPSRRPGGKSVRLEIRPGDAWTNGSERVLCARYDTGETTGDEHWWLVSILVPGGQLGDNLLWELHHPHTLYNIPGLVVAPHAILWQGGKLIARLAAGAGVLNQGWSTWYPNQVILAAPPADQWIDVLVHLKFSEGIDGLAEYFVDPTGTKTFPAAPAWAKAAPTMPFYNGDANRPAVHDVRLYTELGLYRTPPRTYTDVIYHDGCVRRSTRAAVLAV